MLPKPTQEYIQEHKRDNPSLYIKFFDNTQYLEDRNKPSKSPILTAQVPTPRPQPENPPQPSQSSHTPTNSTSLRRR